MHPQPVPQPKKRAAPRKSAAKKAKGEPTYGSDGELLDLDDAAEEANAGGRIRGIDESLPPIIALTDIFSDLVSRVNLDNAVKTLNGRKLRVGTMCRCASKGAYSVRHAGANSMLDHSGTESPLLALGIISSVIGEVKGQKLEVEHIFSCEIEPFKQVRRVPCTLASRAASDAPAHPGLHRAQLLTSSAVPRCD